MKKEYKCICGRIFDNPQSFNGHKSHCIPHLESTGRLELRKTLDSQIGKLSSEKAKNKRQAKIKKELAKWVSEQHTCEKCGKVMTEKFGSGRFCSRQCANSRNFSDTAKDKKRQAMNRIYASDTEAYMHKVKKDNIERYYLNPTLCEICGEKLPYEKRYKKLCGSKSCKSIFESRKITQLRDRIGPFNGHKNYKWGYYQGIKCDSSWELAYLVYHLDHNFSIVRNSKGFKYLYEGKEHTYYPDFLLNNQTFIEIKNYWTPQVQAKIDSFPKDFNFKILYKKDIKECIDYCISKYGKQYTIELYDKEYPNYLHP